jgi:hypothetical protein
MAVKTYNVAFDAAGVAVSTTLVNTPTTTPRIVQVEATSLANATKAAKILYSQGASK